jgi:hypothetical protein
MAPINRDGANIPPEAPLPRVIEVANILTNIKLKRRSTGN